MNGWHFKKRATSFFDKVQKRMSVSKDVLARGDSHLISTNNALFEVPEEADKIPDVSCADDAGDAGASVDPTDPNDEAFFETSG